MGVIWWDKLGDFWGGFTEDLNRLFGEEKADELRAEMIYD